MSEYIVELPIVSAAEEFVRKIGAYNCMIYGYQITGEVVRCRDCKHYKPWLFSRPENGGDCVLNKVEVDVQSNGFCAWGERKDDGDD